MIRSTIAQGRTSKEIISITIKKGTRAVGAPEGTISPKPRVSFLDNQIIVPINNKLAYLLTLKPGIKPIIAPRTRSPYRGI